MIIQHNTMFCKKKIEIEKSKFQENNIEIQIFSYFNNL